MTFGRVLFFPRDPGNILNGLLMNLFSLFCFYAAQHAQIPWRSMRGMRNRMAHGYFDIDLAVVWDTLQTALTALKVQLDSIVSA